MNVPFANLKLQYKNLKGEIDEAIGEVIANTSFINGPSVRAFEANFGKKMGLSPEHVVGVANGTCAVRLALQSLGVGVGDEVLVPSHTFIATIEAIVQLGAIPVFVDISPKDYQLDSTLLEGALTTKTKAVLVVHLYGTICDVGSIRKFCDKNQLKMVEDCAQAHFATWEGKHAGSWGDAAAYSFYPGKNLGAFGDAGLVVTKQAETASWLRRYIDHGRSDKYLHQFVGDNLRLDSIQAAVLNVKLRYIDQWNTRRRELASIYDARLDEMGVKFIEPDKRCSAVYHLYIAEVTNREEISAKLKSDGISTGVHYPIPCHMQPALSSYSSEKLLVTEKIAPRILSLPIFAEQTDEEANYVVSRLLEHLGAES